MNFWFKEVCIFVFSFRNENTDLHASRDMTKREQQMLVYENDRLHRKLEDLERYKSKSETFLLISFELKSFQIILKVWYKINDNWSFNSCVAVKWCRNISLALIYFVCIKLNLSKIILMICWIWILQVWLLLYFDAWFSKIPDHNTFYRDTHTFLTEFSYISVLIHCFIFFHIYWITL